MKISEINPYIRFAAHSELFAPCRINKRIIFDFELLYVEDGQFLLTYNENEYLCNKGDLLLICPGISHSFDCRRVNLIQPHIHFDMQYDFDSERVYICFQDYPSLSELEQLMIRENVFPQFADDPHIHIKDRNTFLSMFFDVIDDREHNSLQCKAKMLKLIQMIILDNDVDTFSQITNNTNVIQQIKSHIDSNYEQNFTLDDLAKQFSYSKYYIERIFKQEYGISIMKYRNSKRMKAAKQLLQMHSVSETARIMGFSSIYSFSRAFSAVYGIPPSKYKDDEN